MALLTQMYSTTRANRNMSLADNLTNNNAFLWYMNENNKVKTFSGGRDLTEPLLYGSLSNVKWYDGYETFTVDTGEEQVTAAVYDHKQIGGFSFISGREEHQNTGKHDAVNLVTSKDEGLIADLENAVEVALFNDGVTDPKAFGGLQYLVADDPTAAGTPGGIDQATEAWWRNQTSNPTFADAAAVTAGIQSEMNAMYLATARGKDLTDLWVADTAGYTGYWSSLQAIQRITNAKMGEAGFHALEFMGAPFIFTPAAPANHVYALNCKFLRVRKSAGRWFTDEAAQVIQSADYTLFPNWTMANLTCNNRARQGVIHWT